MEVEVEVGRVVVWRVVVGGLLPPPLPPDPLQVNYRREEKSGQGTIILGDSEEAWTYHCGTRDSVAVEVGVDLHQEALEHAHFTGVNHLHGGGVLR